MFKKLKERIYNKKAKKELEDVLFDNFMYCGDSEFPMFIRSGTRYTNHKFYVPETDVAFRLAFEKLKNKFYERYVLDDIKNRIRVYMAHFNISEETYEYCVKMFENKSAIVTSDVVKNDNI